VDTPTCDVTNWGRNRFLKALGRANHAHTRCYNMAPPKPRAGARPEVERTAVVVFLLCSCCVVVVFVVLVVLERCVAGVKWMVCVDGWMRGEMK